jgi:hypothetical protein
MASTIVYELYHDGIGIQWGTGQSTKLLTAAIAAKAPDSAVRISACLISGKACPGSRQALLILPRPGGFSKTYPESDMALIAGSPSPRRPGTELALE